jgi:A/G-specific adenine glycosylase
MNYSLDRDAAERVRFRSRLLRWYRTNRRDLPWRQTSDPYHIWVSEIMLQQTRVAAVLGHYRTIVERFPDVSTLAAAPLTDVLAAWSGLGYYRRARSLHAAAIQITQSHRGQIPRTLEELLLLPGFGRYTAAAVASIAFAKPTAVLDGNVERVLRRLMGTSDANTKVLWSVAQMLLSRRSPGDFNQAMMELGATVCFPRDPDCRSCPVKPWCATRGKLPGKRQPLRNSREITVILARKQGKVLLLRRPESESVMPGLWELPPAPTVSGSEPLFVVRHAIMQTNFRVTVIAGLPHKRGGAQWVNEREALRLPLTGLARKILRRVLPLEFV